jgi:LacI family transcriptional regulator
MRTEQRATQTTIVDVAREANVSPMTVSRVFTGKGYTAAATRERILRVARQLGYRPNHVARSLVQSQTRTLGLLFNVGWYCGEVVVGAHEVAREHGYGFIHAVLGRTIGDEEEQLETLRKRRVDGVLLMSPSDVLDNSHLRALRDDGVPLVTINRHWDDPTSWRIFLDHRGAERAVVRRLLAAGHRRVVFVGGSPGHVTRDVRERIEGYREALREVDAWSPVAEAFGNCGARDGETLVPPLLERCPDVTAIVAINDLVASGALRALRRLGRRVPEDVSVVGFDDTLVVHATDPPLTSVRQALRPAGRIGCQWLLDQIENPDEAPRELLLPASLVPPAGVSDRSVPSGEGPSLDGQRPRSL